MRKRVHFLKQYHIFCGDVVLLSSACTKFTQCLSTKHDAARMVQYKSTCTEKVFLGQKALVEKALIVETRYSKKYFSATNYLPYLAALLLASELTVLYRISKMRAF